MADEVTTVYLRLAAGVRHSQVDFAAIEDLAWQAPLQHDLRDPSVYFFALPAEIDAASATRIVSALATKPYIDEAWQQSGGSTALMPPKPSV